MAFFLQLHFMLIFTSLLRLFYRLIVRNISLKSQEQSALLFRHISMDLFCLIFSVELSLLVILLFVIIIRLFIRYY